MKVILKWLSTIVLLSAMLGTVFAAEEPTNNSLLQDINIKVKSAQEIKIYLKFAKDQIVPKAKVTRLGNDIKLSFENSYVQVDNENISLDHPLLKSIVLVTINDDLNLIFKAQKENYFMLKQMDDTYSLTIADKDKIGEIVNEANLNNKDIQESKSIEKKEEAAVQSPIESNNKSAQDVLQSKDATEANATIVDKFSDVDAKAAAEVDKSIEETKKQLAAIAKSNDLLKPDNSSAPAVEDTTKVLENKNATVATEVKQNKIDAKTSAPNVITSKIESESMPITDKITDSSAKQIINTSETRVSNFDFRLTEDKAGKISIGFNNSKITMVADESRNEQGILQFKFKNMVIPSSIAKNYDVTDFGTVVDKLNWTNKPGTNKVILEVYNKSKADYIAYNKDSNLIIEVRDKLDVNKKSYVFNKEYTGRKISLNFQNIELRSVLQIIADFTDLNLVASDSVQGSISLRLMNVPWDQALDIILKTKNLDKRKFGNILMVAPSNEIFELERAELESEQMLEKLIKMETEYFPINYAKAEDIALLINGKNKILSDRGIASFDKRTNLLIIQDTPKKLKEIRDILKKLDSPVKQVLIEARIVRATTDFRKDLGIRWGLSAKRSSKDYRIGIGDTGPNAADVLQPGGNLVYPKKAEAIGDSPGDSGFNIDLGLTDPSAVLGLALAKLPGSTLVHLELSALESEGMLETVSSPKLITANKVPARIEQGTEIPYQEATSSGATNVSFKKAVLSLIVTPQITPDNKVILDINVTNDTPDYTKVESLGVPVIDTKEVETQVLVDNAQTLVLGGIFTQTTNNAVQRVPFLGDLPWIGQLFRKNITRDEKSEFLIFITPKIVVETASK